MANMEGLGSLAQIGENWRQGRRQDRRENVADEAAVLQKERYEAMTPLEIERAKNANRISGASADVAEGTKKGKIDATNAQNMDTLAKYNQRLQSGVPQTEALAELSTADRKIVENALQSERADALLEAGAPGSEAAAQVAKADAQTSAANRNMERDRIAKKMGLDKTKAWAESNAAVEQAETSRDNIDRIKTDRLNNIAGYEAATAINIAKAADATVELQAKLARERLNSDFDMAAFTEQNMGQIAKNALTAVGMARAGGSAAVAALPLINMDANDDGKPDFEGAHAVKIQNIGGEDYVVAVDKEGMIVPSAAAPNEPGMKVSALQQIAREDDTKKKTTKQKATPPVKLSEVDDLDDLSFDTIGDTFGANFDDDEKETYGDLAGVVSSDFEEQAEGMMPKLQNDLSAYYSRMQASGAGIAESRQALNTPEKMARNLYGMNDAGMNDLNAIARANAIGRTKDKLRADGQDIDPAQALEPDSKMLEQEKNKIFITFMNMSQPQM